MKTLFTLTLGIIIGLVAAQYYYDYKTRYFNDLYNQYSVVNYNQLTLQQFEKRWLSEQPWCFSTAEKNYCNAVITCNDKDKAVSSDNQLICLHQKLNSWYPKAITALDEIKNWLTATWEKQTQ